MADSSTQRLNEADERTWPTLCGPLPVSTLN
jgi:hypothetical protein